MNKKLMFSSLLEDIIKNDENPESHIEKERNNI